MEEMVFLTVVNTVKMGTLYIGFPLALDERHLDPTTPIMWLEYQQVHALFHVFQGIRGTLGGQIHRISPFGREILESSPPR